MQKQGKTAKVALVGETVLVTEAKNKANAGMRGQVTDETRNTIKIRTSEGTKTLIKEQITIKIKNKTITGQKLLGRAEERIKQ